MPHFLSVFFLVSRENENRLESSWGEDDTVFFCFSFFVSRKVLITIAVNDHFSLQASNVRWPPQQVGRNTCMGSCVGNKELRVEKFTLHFQLFSLSLLTRTHCAAFVYFTSLFLYYFFFPPFFSVVFRRSSIGWKWDSRFADRGTTC